jgi:hypothetical protein
LYREGVSEFELGAGVAGFRFAFNFGDVIEAGCEDALKVVLRQEGGCQDEERDDYCDWQEFAPSAPAIH